MNLFNYVVVVVLMSSGLWQATALAGDAEIKAPLIGYLEADLEGTDYLDRTEYMHLEGERAVRKTGEANRPGIYDWDTDTIIVVDSYHIQNIQIQTENSAIGVVKFQRVARTQGEGYGLGVKEPRFFIKENNGDEVVQYSLRKIEGEWKVVNPPLPRVSRCLLIKKYQSNVNRIDKRLKSVLLEVSPDPVVLKNIKDNYDYYTKQLNDLVEIGSCK